MSTDREPARIGDSMQTDLKFPHPHTVTVVLETPGAVAFANKLLESRPEAWRIVRAAAALART